MTRLLLAALLIALAGGAVAMRRWPRGGDYARWVEGGRR